jgi:Ran GTPase-activating protein 1
MATTTITLSPPGQREIVDEEKAKAFIKIWTEQLLDHRDKVQAGNGDVLCDRIRLSDKSYTAEAARVIAEFLTGPFEGTNAPLARGIVEADLSDIIAGRLTEEGLQVLRIICDAFVDSVLVDVNLSDNAIGQQGIGACKSALSKKSLEKLSLCNNGLSQETMAQVADILTSDEDGTGCIASNLTKIHFYNNMSGEDG